jgi:hypothetical protein
LIRVLPSEPEPALPGHADFVDERRIAADPGFPLAARGLAGAMLAVAAGDDTLDGAFKDAGRYMAGMIAFYLHVTGGISLARLKAVGAASGLISPGRARALIDYLSYLGLLEEAAPEGESGRPRTPILYHPTPRFQAAWRGHLRAALAATAIVDPAARALLARFDEPAVFAAFVRRQCEGALSSALRPIAWPDIARVFMHPLAGWQIAGVLLASDGDDAFPARGPIAFSMAATARRFGVSRAHVRRMMIHAEEAGLVRLQHDPFLTLTEYGRSQFAAYYAFQLASLADASIKALADCDDAATPGQTETAASA